MQYMLQLLILYYSTFTQYDENKGIEEVNAPLTWEPYLIHELDIPKAQVIEILRKVENTLLFKLLLTYLYLKLGHTVTWNYRVNRSTRLSIRVPNLDLNFIIPNPKVSYNYTKRYRLHRVKKVLEKKVAKKQRVLIIHPSYRPNRRNRYWKDHTWLVNQVKDLL